MKLFKYYDFLWNMFILDIKYMWANYEWMQLLVRVISFPYHISKTTLILLKDKYE